MIDREEFLKDCNLLFSKYPKASCLIAINNGENFRCNFQAFSFAHIFGMIEQSKIIATNEWLNSREKNKQGEEIEKKS